MCWYAIHCLPLIIIDDLNMMIKQNSAKEDVSEGKASSNQEKHHMLSTSFKSRGFTNKFHNFFYLWTSFLLFLCDTTRDPYEEKVGELESWCKSLSITHIQQKTEQTNLIKEKMLEKHESIVCYLTPITPYNSRHTNIILWKLPKFSRRVSCVSITCESVCLYSFTLASLSVFTCWCCS